MRRHALEVILVVLVIVSEVVAVAPPQVEPPEVQKWIADLEAEDFDLRKVAMRKLEEQGEAVVPALRRVTERAIDPDVRLRAVVVAAAIEQKPYGVVRRFAGHTEGVLALAISPDGKRVATSCGILVHVWDIERGKELFQAKGHTAQVYCLDWSRDGKRILSGAMGGTVRLWDAETAKPLHAIASRGFGILNVLFTRDRKKMIFVGYSRVVTIWDVESAKVATTNSDNLATVRGLSLFSDGKRIASAGFDGTLRLLDLETGKQSWCCKTTHVGAASFVAVARTVSASPPRATMASSCSTTRRPANG